VHVSARPLPPCRDRHGHPSGARCRPDRARCGSEPIATGDLTGQVAQALHNTALGLAGAGASFSDVVRLRFFVTHWSPEKADAFMAGIERVADELGIPQPMPPLSLIGVDYLFEPDVLVEVEAFAVLE
jgi:enamine deaminase RidA (YjgF/YER057c/UK114 family)